MGTSEIQETIESGPGGRLAATLALLYKLGGWVVLALAACYALNIVLKLYTTSAEARVADMKTMNEQLVKIIAAESEAKQASTIAYERVTAVLVKVDASNERVARALEQLQSGRPSG